MAAIVNNGPLYNAPPDVDEDDINLGDLLGVVIENRWLIIAITFVAILFGAYRAFTAVPIYQADGLLQVEEKYSGLGTLETSMMYEYISPVNTEIEMQHPGTGPLLVPHLHAVRPLTSGP
jgi:tyrosine-protein kinase Etk/Wzc